MPIGDQSLLADTRGRLGDDEPTGTLSVLDDRCRAGRSLDGPYRLRFDDGRGRAVDVADVSVGQNGHRRIGSLAGIDQSLLFEVDRRGPGSVNERASTVPVRDSCENAKIRMAIVSFWTRRTSPREALNSSRNIAGKPEGAGKTIAVENGRTTTSAASQDNVRRARADPVPFRVPAASASRFGPARIHTPRTSELQRHSRRTRR